MENWGKYKVTKKETKKAAGKVRTKAFGGLYESLSTIDEDKYLHAC